jgi:thiosulfate dehydrogenase [quinone] large subunit
MVPYAFRNRLFSAAAAGMEYTRRMSVTTHVQPRSAGSPLATSRSSRILVAGVRVAAGLLWIQNAGWKTPPRFDALHGWTLNGVDHPVLAPWAWFIRHVVLPNFTAFGWLTLAVEASLGGFLLVGLATRFWALVGIAQTTAIGLTVLHAPHEWAWSYILMGLAHVAIFATAAGRWYGLDGVLRPSWRQVGGPVPRLLLRAS